MDRQEAERRDRVLRAYFEGRDWDDNGEFQLKRDLVMGDLLPEFPFVVDDEWEVRGGHTDEGRGDLVFTDGAGNFAVVEVKWIDGGTDGGSGKTRRRAKRGKRRKVEEQALEYGEFWAARAGTAARIDAYLFTNEVGLMLMGRVEEGAE